MDVTHDGIRAYTTTAKHALSQHLASNADALLMLIHVL